MPEHPRHGVYDYSRAGERILVAHGTGVVHARILWIDRRGSDIYWKSRRWNGLERMDDEGVRWLCGWNGHTRERIKALLASAAL